MRRLIRKIRRAIDFYLFRATFSKKFNLYNSEDEEDLKEVYRIRFEVYCKEYGYLDKNKYPDGLESDEYDKHSVHFILRSKTGELAASVRLIVNPKDIFPVEKHFKLNVLLPNSRKEVAEISRLIVAKKYRKKFLLLALVKGIYIYTKAAGITHTYAVLDDRLFPVLRGMGFHFEKIGTTAIYQGLTSPYILDIGEMAVSLRHGNPLLFKYLNSGLSGYKISKYSL